MKLIREVSRTDKASGKTYHKWRVTLPEQEVKALGWHPNDELEAKVIAGALVLKRLPRSRESKP